MDGAGPAAPCPGASVGLAPIEARDYAAFRDRVLSLTGVDLDQYKREQLLRRLAGLRQRLGVRDLAEYARSLVGDPAELERFRCWFTINVTEFFRDPDRWNDLGDRLLPELTSGRHPLRVWSAGCSHGAEAYSLAMLLARAGGPGPHYLVATDIDPSALRVARTGGPYTAADLANVSPSFVSAYFVRGGPGADAWWVRPELRDAVAFEEADLLRRSPAGAFDLAVCRNVLIYLTEPARQQVLRRFDQVLRPGGVLFLGATELIARGSCLRFAPDGPSFYRRTQG